MSPLVFWTSPHKEALVLSSNSSSQAASFPLTEAKLAARPSCEPKLRAPHTDSHVYPLGTRGTYIYYIYIWLNYILKWSDSSDVFFDPHQLVLAVLANGLNLWVLTAGWDGATGSAWKMDRTCSEDLGRLLLLTLENETKKLETWTISIVFVKKCFCVINILISWVSYINTHALDCIMAHGYSALSRPPTAPKRVSAAHRGLRRCRSFSSHQGPSIFTKRLEMIGWIFNGCVLFDDFWWFPTHKACSLGAFRHKKHGLPVTFILVGCPNVQQFNPFSMNDMFTKITPRTNHPMWWFLAYTVMICQIWSKMI